MKTVKRLISTVCFLLILVVLLNGLTFITRDKSESNHILSYYDEEENSLDVVFVGSSHTMCSVYPMELYHEYGITSYDCASSDLALPQVYYLVVEALKTQKPKILVLDISGVAWQNVKSGPPEFAHIQLDNMKWSLNKMTAINDLFENPGDRLEYYFPLLKFHTRWKELILKFYTRWKELSPKDFKSPKDFERTTDVSKGAYISEVVLENPEPVEIMPEDYVGQISEYAEAYLRKALDYCCSQNVQVLLLNPPSLEDETDQRKYNAVYAIAEEYGFPYLNLMHHWDDIGFDYTTDFRDTGHCNRSGAEKVTAYMGKFLKENYELPDRREDSTYATIWNDAYNQYVSRYF
ncbi:MAG: hypothetical protein HDT38_01920 [Clostridiales bacterium]|nr:hypothetical protein [Clostridiales bacterium]